MVSGAELGPALSQDPEDLKCLATASLYISVNLAATKTFTTKPIFLCRDVVRCDEWATYLSLEPNPYEGVVPVHSREVPLPLTRNQFIANWRGPKEAHLGAAAIPSS